MTLEEVKDLIKAGFTADEIRAMQADAPQQAAPEGAAPDPAPEGAAPDPAPEPAQNNQDPAGVTESVKALSDTMKELQKTIKEMQAANVAGAQQEPKKTPTAEDAIKNFLSKM